MSRRSIMLAAPWLVAALGLSAGCEAHDESAIAPPAADAPPARAFFPTAVGDRWREQVGPASRTVGVTGQTASGLLVTFGSRDRRPSFYRVDDEGVTMVRPDGADLEPLLRGPVREGASFRYTSGEGPLSAPCTAEFTETGVIYPVGNVADCVVLERTCRHPRGGLFRAPTTRRSTETWCPSLGRVRTAMELEPPIEDASPPPTTEVVHYVVAGHRVTPDTFGCAQMLLLESDIAAACGPGWGLQAETAGREACTARFTRQDDALEVRVSRRQSEHAATIARDRSLEAAPEGTEARGDTEGRHTLFVSATAGCEGDRLARLLPLLASMVRAP
ncbi:MAG: hypothetical protein AB8I08_02465 [Sandaracinaceae bacterium]